MGQPFRHPPLTGVNPAHGDTGTIRYEVGKIQITLDTLVSCDILVDVMNEEWRIREVFRDNVESYVTAPLHRQYGYGGKRLFAAPLIPNESVGGRAMKILKILSVLLIPILTACPDPSIPEPPQAREALRLVYGTDNRIAVIKW